jgi:8-oxo-dGTP diphosphatase
MSHQHETVVNTFGNRLRLRVCGICFQEEKLLIVRHNALGKKGYLLAPPGGGLHFDENAEACLIREFKEETGLEIKVNRFLFVHEFLEPPLHAIELFFEVEVTGGRLTKGTDPEMNEENQIIDQVLYMSPKEIDKERGEQVHNVLNLCKHPRELLNLQGYFIFHSKS